MILHFARPSVGAQVGSGNVLSFGFLGRGNAPVGVGTGFQNPILTATNLRLVRFGFSPRGSAVAALPTDVITDTEKIQLPINCVLADQQFYETRIDVNDIGPANFSSRVARSASKTARISGDSPSFTTKTDSKGYD